MNAIMHDKVRIAEAVNAKIISLDDAPLGYQNFDQGESVKCAAPAHRARLASDSRISASQCVGSLRRYVMDPHGVTGKVQALG